MRSTVRERRGKLTTRKENNRLGDRIVNKGTKCSHGGEHAPEIQKMERRTIKRGREIRYLREKENKGASEGGRSVWREENNEMRK